MSELRRHLELGRAKHLEARYVGDLASELLTGATASRRSHRRALWQSLAGIAAAAALVAMVVWIGSRPVRIPQVAVNTPTDQLQNEATEPGDTAEDVEQFAFGGLSMVPMPGLPADDSDSSDELVPPMSFGMPSFPSLSDMLSEGQESDATTKETT